MKFNQLTSQISLGLLGLTALYTLVYSGLTGLLLTASIGLIAAAFLDEFELIVAVTIIFAVFYSLFLKRFLTNIEPFTNENDPSLIKGRLAKMSQSYHPGQVQQAEPSGVYHPLIEGFADVATSEEKEGAPSESSSAPSKETQTNQVSKELVDKTTKAVESKENKPTIENEEFQSATNELFKLGKLPSEHTEGPRLDPGKTLQKAMSALDPSTISSMTTDTKQLIETQKGLMSMLSQMRPVLADGKELLQTFTGMFGNDKH